MPCRTHIPCQSQPVRRLTSRPPQPMMRPAISDGHRRSSRQHAACVRAPLLDAVRTCSASLWTGRAVAYRVTNGNDHRAVQLAVGIQEMDQSSVAGVMFTANPLTGRRRQAVIDASPGLGEAVVSGAVTPDHFVADPASGAIVERRLGDKRLAVRPLPGGGTERVELAEQSAVSSLTDEQILALASLGARVEAHYDAPQDIEW